MKNIYLLTSVRQHGFTLIELAIVLVIMGLLIGSFLMPLTQQIESARRTNAEQQVQEIRDALVSYAMVNGRLPCPATATSSGNEAPTGGTANCTRQHGFVPHVQLGIDGPVNGQALLLDPWGSPYRYSVTSANTYAFVKTNGMNTTGMATLAPNLRICRSVNCAAATDILYAEAPFVVYSLGKNYAAVPGNTDYERENAEANFTGTTFRVSNDNDFIKQDYSSNTGATTEFDDIVTWVSKNVLYSKLIESKQISP